jgi:hypothetical protein
MATFTTVFLSSTAKDLQPYRDAVVDAIRKVKAYHPVNMENFGSRDGEPAAVCLSGASLRAQACMDARR